MGTNGRGRPDAAQTLEPGARGYLMSPSPIFCPYLDCAPHGLADTDTIVDRVASSHFTLAPVADGVYAALATPAGS